MTGKSNSFRQVTPFYPRFGVLGNSLYSAFPTDRISAPGAEPFGCLSVTPRSDFVTGGDEGGPFSPDEIIYTVKNIGGAEMDWSLSIDQTWIEANILSGTLASGASISILVSLTEAAADLPSNTDPYAATLSFVNETNGCGDIDLGAFITVTGVIFEQFDGPFEFPAKAFFGNGEYYSAQVVNGENRVFFDCLYHTMSSSRFNGDIPVVQTDNGYPKGVHRSDWSGSVIYDIDTDSYIGDVTAILEESGVLPGGVSISPAIPTRVETGETFDTLLQDLLAGGAGRFFLSSQKYSEGGTEEGTFVRKWFSPPPLDNGCFVNGVMGQIWVDGYTLLVTSSTPITVETLGVPVARTGNDARTQNVATYDPDTNTYTGNKSRAKINVNIPAGKTTTTGDFKFLVTPNDLSPPYFLYVSRQYTVTPETTYQAIIEFPWVVDASVYYFSGVFSFNPSVYQGFSIAITGDAGTELTTIQSNAAWPADILFGSPCPNADALDSFDDFGGSDTESGGTIGFLDTGYGWNGAYGFVTQDPVDCSDDFEFYTPGDISILNFGLGWYLPGVVFAPLFTDVYDDFESYSTGSITFLDFPLEFWIGDGEFTS
jgi:hypothetical protein